MKSSLILAVLAVTMSAADHKSMPSEVTLTTGRVLRNVQVIRWEANRVVLRHSAGADPIAFSLFAVPTPAELPAIKAGMTIPAATPSASAAPNEIQGQVFFLAGGNSRAPKIAGVEMRLYRAADFRTYEGSRAFPAGHDRVPESQSSTIGFGNQPNMQELADYMETEFKSWDGLPPPLAKATTDLEGRFTLKVPPNSGPVLIFCRHQMLSSYGRGGSRRFCYVWTAEPNAEGPTILGNDQIHPGMKKALDIFFR